MNHNKKCETCGMKYKDCESCLEYTNVEDVLLIWKWSFCRMNCQKNFDGDLKK